MEQQWLIQPEALKAGEKDQPALRKIRAADEAGGRCAERGRRYEKPDFRKLRQRCAVILNL